MTETLQHDTGRTGLGEASGLFAIRLATGLVQGLALYLLYLAADSRVWPETQPVVFGALALAAGYVPVVATLGIERDTGRVLNVNGDTAAAATATALGADVVVLVTAVGGGWPHTDSASSRAMPSGSLTTSA